MVDNWNYEIKRKSRRVILDFARRHMPHYDPEDVRMLCLAGIDCADIYEISRPLRIPDKQVTIVERDADIFEQIEKKKEQGKIECDLYYGDLADYLERTNERFRFISLDYTGQPTPERMGEVFTIFDRQILQPHSILHTNFYGKMERSHVQLGYKGIIGGRYLGKGLSYEEIETKSNELTLQKMRDEIITEFLIISALHGTTGLPKTLLENRDASQIMEHVKSDFLKLREEAPNLTSIYKWNFIRNMSIKFHDKLQEILRKKLLDSILVDATVAGQILQPYYALYFERYKYAGPKGANMYTDLIEFDQRRKVYDANPVKLVWDENNFALIGDIPVSQPSGGWKFKNPESLIHFLEIEKLQKFGWRFFDSNWTPRFKEREQLN